MRLRASKDRESCFMRALPGDQVSILAHGGDVTGDATAAHHRIPARIIRFTRGLPSAICHLPTALSG